MKLEFGEYKRGQMELIGLAVVVMLVLLSFVLYIMLTLPQGGASREKINEAREVGVALENSMLATTIPDCGYDLRTALERCKTTSSSQCNGAPVCSVAHGAWLSMLKGTLGDEEEGRFYYEAEVRDGDSDVLSVNPNTDFSYTPIPCSSANRYAAPEQPIPTRQGTLYFSIAFCEG